MITWVIGSGGLLGSAINRQSISTFSALPVPWEQPERAAEVLSAESARFFSEVRDEPWAILWAAGHATTSSRRESAMSELVPFQALLTSIASQSSPAHGTFFLTSSAGGVYAGSSDPPFGVATSPAPISPYGELKVAQEKLCADQLKSTCRVVIGRVSNLYGPGQNLGKLQGLISRLALAALNRQPINIFVPLDTIRDYIFVDNAAEAILDLTYSGRPEGTPRVETHVIASGQGATVGYLLQTMNHVTKRHIPVAFGTHSSAPRQTSDLRLMPTVDIRHHMPLPAGMKLVYRDIVERLQQSRV